MLVAFLYGSMVWGIFPELFPEKNISYESHFWGLIIGLILAFYYRKLGPQKETYDWEEEDDEVYDDTHPDEITIKYSNYKTKEE